MHLFSYPDVLFARGCVCPFFSLVHSVLVVVYDAVGPSLHAKLLPVLRIRFLMDVFERCLYSDNKNLVSLSLSHPSINVSIVLPMAFTDTTQIGFAVSEVVRTGRVTLGSVILS